MKKFTNKIILAALAVIFVLSLGACVTNQTKNTTAKVELTKESEEKATILKVGASPSPHSEILEQTKEILAEQNIELQIIEFTDYVMPNKALDAAELDANFFQHKPYLDEFNSKNATELVSAAAIHYEPMGIYGGKNNDIKSIADKAQIAVPNDPTNEARALLLLQKQGLITLKNGAGLNATARDIAENPKNIKIVEMEAAQLPRALQDVEFAVINGNYAVEAGIAEAVLVSEDKESDGAKQFANIIAVKKGDENREDIKALINALESEKVKNFIAEKYGNTVIPMF